MCDRWPKATTCLSPFWPRHRSAFVNSEKYGAPIDQLAATTGFDEAAPDQVVKLWTGQQNTRVYQAIASTGTSLSFDYVQIVPVNEGKES